MTVPLPTGFSVELDADTKQLDATTWYGGSPARVMRLSDRGAAVWQELQRSPIRSPTDGVLARRLTDAGLAHPHPPPRHDPFDVTVVIPVRDRAALLDRCLAALGRAHPVLVVDDGSSDPDTIAAIADRHGAAVVRRHRNGGPAAARNTGLEQVRSEFVAFLDSDCAPAGDWIGSLAAHFADPLVGAVAPRILAARSRSSAGRYATVFGSLDLGTRQAGVVPSSRVAYVPTAALLVRRQAIDELAAEEAFDPELRVGEDVDLVWRLHEAGWRIRYQPEVRVEHREPDTWPALLARRYRYGTSAAPLTRRHPDAMHPLVLHAGPTATVAAVLARRPRLALTAYFAYTVGLAARLRKARIPRDGLLRASADAVRHTALGVGRYLCQFAAPALLIGLLRPGRRHRHGRRAALGLVLLVPALRPGRPAGFGPVGRALALLADDIAYGTGVWAGCARERTLRPLLPAVSWRSVRVVPVSSPETGRPAT